MDPFLPAPAPQLPDTAESGLSGNMQPDQYKPASAKRTWVVLACVSVLMFGFGFALVPIYDSLCRVLGINGKIEQVDSGDRPTANPAPAYRDVRVELVVSNSAKLGWDFYPLVSNLSVQPGDSKTIQFHARNNSGQPMTIQAVPSVTPGIGARYLVKTECFCFQQQTLKAGESVNMPLVFYVDPDLPEKYRTLTLSYALFEAGPG